MPGHLNPEPGQCEQIPSPLARLRQFCFPGGEQSARLIRAVKTTQQGEIRMTPEARWIPFTAEETVEAQRSSFRWEARLSTRRLMPVVVRDAYANGHGQLTVKAGGIVPLQKVTGPDVDKGELQRYLASLLVCPPMLLQHPALECTVVAPFTLRLRDREDVTGATVDLELSENGRPLLCRAERPRLAGKRCIPTPWLGSYIEFRDWEGMRVASRLEVAWQLGDGPFIYFRTQVASYTALR